MITMDAICLMCLTVSTVDDEVLKIRIIDGMEGHFSGQPSYHDIMLLFVLQNPFLLFSMLFISSLSLLSPPILIHYNIPIIHITHYLHFTTFHSPALLSDWTKGFDSSKCISVQSGVSTVFLRPWGETGGEGKRYEGNYNVLFMCCLL